TDRWPFAARKGDVIDIELRAQRLGSLLTGVLTVEDDKGKVLGRAESATPNADPSLRFTAPSDGTFTVVVAEKFRMLAGPHHAYRLRLGRPEAPDFRLRVNVDALTIPRAGQATLQVSVDALGGFREAINLTLEGLPADVTVTGTTIAAGQNAV